MPDFKVSWEDGTESTVKVSDAELAEWIANRARLQEERIRAIADSKRVVASVEVMPK